MGSVTPCKEVGGWLGSQDYSGIAVSPGKERLLCFTKGPPQLQVNPKIKTKFKQKKTCSKECGAGQASTFITVASMVCFLTVL